METKNKQITLLQGKVLLIELPEGAVDRFLTLKKDGLICRIPQQGVDALDKFEAIKLPPGNWRIIGMLSEVTEEQVIPIVERESKPEYSYEQEYPEYVGDEWWYRDYQAQDDGDYKYSHYTALESLESAIEAVGYYLDNNPIPPFHERKDDWLMAQERVLDRSRCLLLGREG